MTDKGRCSRGWALRLAAVCLVAATMVMIAGSGCAKKAAELSQGAPASPSIAKDMGPGMGMPGGMGGAHPAGGAPGGGADAQMAAATSAEMSAATATGIAPAARNRKLIRTAQMELEVEDAEGAARKAQTVALTCGGLVGNMNLTRMPTGSVSVSLTVRIPVDQFDRALAKLRELGKVTTLTTSVEDVTGAYTDLSARIRNAKREEQEVLKLYDRGGKLADVITVEEKLAQVRGEIEGLESQMRVMKEQVDLSTISVGFAEEGEAPIAEEPYSIAYELRGAGRTALRLLQNLLTATIYIVIVGWVVWVPLALLIWLGVRRGRARAERRHAQRPVPPNPPPVGE